MSGRTQSRQVGGVRQRDNVTMEQWGVVLEWKLGRLGEEKWSVLSCLHDARLPVIRSDWDWCRGSVGVGEAAAGWSRGVVPGVTTLRGGGTDPKPRPQPDFPRLQCLGSTSQLNRLRLACNFDTPNTPVDTLNP